MALKQMYPDDFYNTQNLKDKDLMSDKEFIKEYNRQTKEMNRRLDRLEKNFPRSKVVKEHEKAPEIESFMQNGRFNRSKASMQLNEAYKFNKSETTMMKGFRKQLRQSVESFNRTFSEKDEDGNVIKKSRPFTSKNIWDLYDFLDEYQEMNKNQIMPSSDEVVDIFVEARRLNMDMKSLAKNMDYWKNHYEDMQKLTPIESTRPVSSSEYEKLL